MLITNLKSLREEKGLTQNRLCEELKSVGCYITGSAYAKYETGIRDIPCVVIIQLAGFYGTTCDYVLGVTRGSD